VVCLGVESNQSHHLRYETDDEVLSPTERTIGLSFSYWSIPSPLLPDAVIDEIEEGFDMRVRADPADPASGKMVDNWDPVLDRNVAKTRGLEVQFTVYLKMDERPKAPSAEVWMWDYHRVQAEPLLTYPGCDDFEYCSWSAVECKYHLEDEMLETFLHAAAGLATVAGA
jgi:hypothetical protein